MGQEGLTSMTNLSTEHELARQILYEKVRKLRNIGANVYRYLIYNM